MIFDRLLAATIVISLAAPAGAATPAEAAALYDALALDRVVDIMHEEGLRHGAELAEEMFPDRVGSGWSDTVAAIYDTETMARIVRRDLSEALGDAEAAPLLDFFGSPPGERIVTLEIAAREALLDPDVEAMAEEAWANMLIEGDPRTVVLEAFVEANDLVESNVTGSMNASYAFYQGLAEGGALDDLSEAQVLADVWQQEDAIRLDTEDWVYSYLALAYGPLADEDIERYTALSLTPEGKTLNRALFAAFDEMYVTLSRALGRAAAGQILGEDI